MRPLAAVIGVVAAGAAGFVILGSSRTAEGPGQSAGGAAGTAVVSTAAHGEAPAGGTAKAVPVHVVSAVSRDLPRTLEVTGSLRTDGDVQISSRLAGKVAAVLVKEGGRVRAGDVLVRLDERELRAQLARARALRASAEARLSLARNQATWKDTAAQESFRRAQAALASARTRVQQAKTTAALVASETKTNVQTAESNLTMAKDRLAVTKEITRKQELRQAELAVEQAQAQAAQARVDEQNVGQTLSRRRLLFQQDAIAKEEVDEAERQHKAALSRVKIAEASVDSARQALDLAKEGSRPEEVRIFIGRMLAAERALKIAQSELQRVPIAEADVAAAEAAEQQAAAALRTAKAALVQSRLSKDEIAGARAAIEQATAEILVLTTQLSDLAIRAPVSGVVSRRLVHTGEMVTPGARLMDLVAADTTYLEAQVPELEIHQVRPGIAADVRVDAMAGRTLRGTVREVIPVADRSSKTFRVRVAVLAGRDTLPVGGFARAVLHVGTKAGAVVVPMTAIMSESGERFVWVVDGKDGKPAARRQAVRIGLDSGTEMELLDGVKTGDRVITDPTPALSDGVPLSLSAGA